MFTTRAPSISASRTESSVEPLSATMTSPSIPAPRNEAIALRTQTATVSCSFTQGITIDNSTRRSLGASTSWSIAIAELPRNSLGVVCRIDVIGLRLPAARGRAIPLLWHGLVPPTLLRYCVSHVTIPEHDHLVPKHPFARWPESYLRMHGSRCAYE